MKLQPNRNYKSDDEVMTPDYLAKDIVNWIRPRGKVLEPCCGDGVFLKYLPKADWCEIKKGRDFFKYKKKVQWIITNPPWSQIRSFLKHSMEISERIIFLVTINHLWTKARLRDMKDAGFGIRKIILIDTPKSFPQSGFQLGVIEIKKGYRNNIIIIDMGSSKITKTNIKEVKGDGN